VSHDAFNRDEHYAKILVVHLTTARRFGGPYDWEVEIRRGIAGLPAASVAKCNEVYTVFKHDLEAQVGSLPAPLMKSVDRALALALALPLQTVLEEAGGPL
jgi:mRNA-degrading endonuclease toxin of MazEF toxin-antitoxin module